AASIPTVNSTACSGQLPLHAHVSCPRRTAVTYFSANEKPLLFRPVAALPLQISNPANTSVRYKSLENAVLVPPAVLSAAPLVTASFMNAFRSKDRVIRGE